MSSSAKNANEGERSKLKARKKASKQQNIPVISHVDMPQIKLDGQVTLNWSIHYDKLLEKATQGNASPRNRTNNFECPPKSGLIWFLEAVGHDLLVSPSAIDQPSGHPTVMKEDDKKGAIGVFLRRLVKKKVEKRMERKFGKRDTHVTVKFEAYDLDNQVIKTLQLNETNPAPTIGCKGFLPQHSITCDILQDGKRISVKCALSVSFQSPPYTKVQLPNKSTAAVVRFSSKVRAIANSKPVEPEDCTFITSTTTDVVDFTMPSSSSIEGEPKNEPQSATASLEEPTKDAETKAASKKSNAKSWNMFARAIQGMATEYK